MPRARERVSEMPQKQPLKVPFHRRTSSSESDPLHQRPTDRNSPKLSDRRSPRGVQSDPLHPKKLGTRVADLESQLGQAQQELKKLKDQLASTETAKREAQEELEKKKSVSLAPEIQEECEEKGESLVNAPAVTSEIQETDEKNNCSTDSRDENSCEDVFEVQMETVLDKTMMQVNDEREDSETKPADTPSEQFLPEIEKPSMEEMNLLKDEITMLKTKLEEKDVEVEALQTENISLAKKVTEMEAEVVFARNKDEERELKLTQTEMELETTKVNVSRLSHELETVGNAKEALESEMKTLRVQTEQWRKAADAAAAVLSGGMDMNGNGKFSGRCGSMDKHVVSGSVFELAGAYTGYEGSPLMGDDLDDRYGNGKRKNAGMKMFGDLWKKKGQK